MNTRATYRQLLLDHRLSQARSAELICQQTQRPCSVRTVRSWLNDPNKASSRPCPEWAVHTLAQALGIDLAATPAAHTPTAEPSPAALELQEKIKQGGLIDG